MVNHSNTSGRPAIQFARDERPGTSSGNPSSRQMRAPAEISADELVFRTRVALRSHPHVNNVFTHISGGDWGRVEDSLRAIFDPMAARASLSPLTRNILDLLCAERGVTGRILKPYFRAFVYELLEPELAARIISRLAALHLGLDRTASEAVGVAAGSAGAGKAEDRNRSQRGRNERVIKIADIDPSHRHTVIVQLFEHLDPNDSLQLVLDHDPKRLRLQLQDRHGARCDWTWLEDGPETWRARLRLRSCGTGRSCRSDRGSWSASSQLA